MADALDEVKGVAMLGGGGGGGGPSVELLRMLTAQGQQTRSQLLSLQTHVRASPSPSP